MSADQPTSFRKFVEDYRRVRLAEGFASTDPAFARGLPFRDTTGRNAGAWRLRALHYLILRLGLAVIPGMERVLDVGAGNGWLARRLAASFRVTALDVDASGTGLGSLDDRRVARVCGELEVLPLADRSFDVVIAAASLHYAVDLSRALAEMSRVLRPGGVLIIADSPVYRDARQREAAWRRTLEHYTATGVPHLAGRYRGLTRDDLHGCGLFRFVTLSPGLTSWRAAFDRLRGADPGVRLPLLLGRKR